MRTRVAVMGIIVEDPESVEQLNEVLHEFAGHIIGRMGIPYRERGISVISVAVDAPENVISALAGRVGAIPGVSVKTAYSNVSFDEDDEPGAEG
jgi:putative iron-only hydrogenase system regulator